MQPPSPGPRPSLLLVEDEAHIRQLMTLVLARAGYDVATATRCSEAEALIAARPFSVAVLDIGLPDGRGDQIARQLRAQSPGTRIVLISAGDYASLAEPGGNPGDTFLAKPFSNADLVAAVRHPDPDN